MAKKTYIISYDLRNGSADDYEGLYDAIKAYGTWAHITESTWAVATTESAKEIRQYLAEFLGKGSRIFVVRSGTEGAWRNVICRNEWLKKWL